MKINYARFQEIEEANEHVCAVCTACGSTGAAVLRCPMFGKVEENTTN